MATKKKTATKKKATNPDGNTYWSEETKAKRARSLRKNAETREYITSLDLQHLVNLLKPLPVEEIERLCRAGQRAMQDRAAGERDKKLAELDRLKDEIAKLNNLIDEK